MVCRRTLSDVCDVTLRPRTFYVLMPNLSLSFAEKNLVSPLQQIHSHLPLFLLAPWGRSPVVIASLYICQSGQTLDKKPNLKTPTWHWGPTRCPVIITKLGVAFLFPPRNNFPALLRVKNSFQWQIIVLSRKFLFQEFARENLACDIPDHASLQRDNSTRVRLRMQCLIYW